MVGVVLHCYAFLYADNRESTDPEFLQGLFDTLTTFFDSPRTLPETARTGNHYHFVGGKPTPPTVVLLQHYVAVDSLKCLPNQHFKMRKGGVTEEAQAGRGEAVGEH